MSLPSVSYGSGIGKWQQTQFRGYNHNLAAMDGEIYDMKTCRATLRRCCPPGRQGT